MVKRFDIVERSIYPADKETNLIDFYINPDENEKNIILQNLDFDDHTLSSSLDPDEVSRVEFEKDYTFIIWKRPNNYSFDTQLQFNVSSMGILLTKQKIIFISKEDYNVHDRRDYKKIESLIDYLLKVLFYTIRHYVDHIKAINMMSKELQEKITLSLENKYLVQMFSLSESLVYYINAINANNTVLIKLKNNAQRLGFTTEEKEYLDDLIIEGNQCYKQAEIYSTILGGLMDARGNLINNNMNTLLKKLTIINVIFLPLNLIASIGGMSEFSVITKAVPWYVSYSLFCLGMGIVGWLTAVWLNSLSNKGNRQENKARISNIKFVKNIRKLF